MWEQMAFGETDKYPGPSPELTDTENWELSKVEGAIDKFINQGKHCILMRNWKHVKLRSSRFTSIFNVRQWRIFA